MITKQFKFSKNQSTDFAKELKSRINNYFKSQNKSKFGSFPLYLKAAFMFALYFGPYFLIILGVFESSFINILLWSIMGVGMAGIGLSVMHDAIHGVFSRRKWLNKLMERSMELIGGDGELWRLQHNVLHHSYTNVMGADEDIDGPGIMRFSPNHPKRKIHQYQHIFGPFLYGLMTIGWVGWKDYLQAYRFKSKGLVKENEFKKLITRIIFYKLFYFAYVIAIPLVMGVEWYEVLVGFFLLHYICSLILSLVFQSAHVVPEAEFPMATEEGKIENNWAIHQIQTTSNFSQKSIFFSWFIGGLNFQIEHHLFSNISHVHYKNISKIVRETANEYGLPYNETGSFFQSIGAHIKMLKQLGRA
jgi:linoleoyl-CoA desaturase